MCKKYNIPNPRFFNEPSPAMAYATGLIMADGNIDKEITRLTYKCSERDIDLLEWLRDTIAPEHPIYYNQYTTEMGSLSKSVQLRASNVTMVKDLINLGIVPRKSGFEHIPKNLPKKFIPNFILGFFDGDGSVIQKNHIVTKDGQNRHCMRVQFTSSTSRILEEIKSYLGIGRVNICCRNGKMDRYDLHIENYLDIKQFYDTVYNNIDHFCLQRKRKKIETYLNQGVGKSTKKKIVAFGKVWTCQQLANHVGISRNALYHRMSDKNLGNMSIEDRCLLPDKYVNNQPNLRLITAFGKTQNMSAWARDTGMSYWQIVNRFNNPKLKHLSSEQILKLPENFKNKDIPPAKEL